MKTIKLVVAIGLLTAMGCGDGALEVGYPTVGPDNLQTVASELRPRERLQRVTGIRDAARARGLTNAVLLGGIADAETNLAHCWSEARWACKGPASSSCGGGPVIAGSGDGPCANKQGGLGMFQFDAGTHSQTLAREGNRILTVEGNTQAAVDFVTNMVKNSQFVSGVSTNAQALAWMNSLRPGTSDWDKWIRTVVGYYNGCFEGRCRIFHERYNRYDSRTRNVLREFGDEFWYGAGGAPSGGGSAVAGGGSGGSTSGPAPAGRPSTARELIPANATVPTNASISLSWQSVDASSYKVRMEYMADGEWRHYYEWDKRTNVFEVWPQKPDTSYRWAVQACNVNGCADWSAYETFAYGNAQQPADNGGTVADNGGGSTGGSTGGTSPEPAVASGVPGMPASMAPAGGRVDGQSVTLSWSQPMGADEYDIVMYYFDGTDWADYAVWEGKTGGSFEVWPQRTETTYAWAMRACNFDGCSEWSDFQQFYYGR